MEVQKSSQHGSEYLLLQHAEFEIFIQMGLEMTRKPWELCFPFTCQSKPLLALPCWNVLCSASAEQLQNLAVTIPSSLSLAGGSTPLLQLLLYQLHRQKRS